MDIIKLISVNNDELKIEALNIYLKNDYYFSKISDNLPNISNVEEDIETIPDGVQKNQKNYRLISFNNEILGVVDYLSDYPEKDTILIGFFIIKNDKQKQGLGTKIFRYLENLFKDKKETSKTIEETRSKEVALVEDNESLFKKIWNKIISIFKK